MTTRLLPFGPVTSKIPNAVLRTEPATVVLSETVASNIEPNGYGGGY